MSHTASIVESQDIFSAIASNNAPTRWRKLVVGMEMGIFVEDHVVDLVEGTTVAEAVMVVVCD
jgi:hypothetical protein